MRRAQKRENLFCDQLAEKRSRTAPSADSPSGASSSSCAPYTPRVGMGTPEKRVHRRERRRRARKIARRTTIVSEIVEVPSVGAEVEVTRFVGVLVNCNLRIVSIVVDEMQNAFVH